MESIDAENVKLLQDLFAWERRALDPNFLKDLEVDCGQAAAPTNIPLQQAIKELLASAVKLVIQDSVALISIFYSFSFNDVTIPHHFTVIESLLW
ncbi:hypothetical protein ACJRO7_010397 [Eucalyptus globulus]|uniref:Uncharacterized protein n=1 Tax=Eucalyptus globulus TaxID=34317 RepID=A0ABD3LBV8_EUCGL